MSANEESGSDMSSPLQPLFLRHSIKWQKNDRWFDKTHQVNTSTVDAAAESTQTSTTDTTTRNHDLKKEYAFYPIYFAGLPDRRQQYAITANDGHGDEEVHALPSDFDFD